MKREEIRRRALGAAAAVSLTLGLPACTSQVQVGEAAGGGGQGGAEVATNVGGQGGGVVDGTGGVGGVAANGGAGGAVTAPDAGPAGACAGLEGDAYLACCDANLWDWDAGCMAWGPPMPPAMPEVMA